jgi:hypothetical protein
MVDLNSVAQRLGRDGFLYADFRTSRLKRLLLLGAGTLALTVAAPEAIAGTLTNTGGSGQFDDPALWSSTAPGADDDVSITGGTVTWAATAVKQGR